MLSWGSADVDPDEQPWRYGGGREYLGMFCAFVCSFWAVRAILTVVAWGGHKVMREGKGVPKQQELFSGTLAPLV